MPLGKPCWTEWDGSIAAAPFLPSASIVRSAPIRKGQCDGSCMVGQHTVGHVYSISIFSTNLPHVGPGTCALCREEKVVGKRAPFTMMWTSNMPKQQGSASEATHHPTACGNTGSMLPLESEARAVRHCVVSQPALPGSATAEGRKANLSQH